MARLGDTRALWLRSRPGSPSRWDSPITLEGSCLQIRPRHICHTREEPLNPIPHKARRWARLSATSGLWLGAGRQWRVLANKPTGPENPQRAVYSAGPSTTAGVLWGPDSFLFCAGNHCGRRCLLEVIHDCARGAGRRELACVIPDSQVVLCVFT